MTLHDIIKDWIDTKSFKNSVRLTNLTEISVIITTNHTSLAAVWSDSVHLYHLVLDIFVDSPHWDEDCIIYPHDPDFFIKLENHILKTKDS